MYILRNICVINLYHTSTILITALRDFYTFKKQNYFEIPSK